MYVFNLLRGCKCLVFRCKVNVIYPKRLSGQLYGEWFTLRVCVVRGSYSYDQTDVLSRYVSYCCSCVLVAVVNPEQITYISFNINQENYLFWINTTVPKLWRAVPGCVVTQAVSLPSLIAEDRVLSSATSFGELIGNGQWGRFLPPNSSVVSCNYIFNSTKFSSSSTTDVT
jgi:hypothetical protein